MATIDYRPLAIITAASRGIGLELSKQFADHGFDLLMCAEGDAVHPAALEVSRHGVHALAVQAELSTYAGVENLYERIRATGRPVDIAVINAGMEADRTYSREIDFEKELRLIRLNVVSSVHLANRLLKDMVDRGQGRMLFTSSVASTLPGPLNATYAASTAFLRSFAEAIRVELKDSGVTVTALTPRTTDATLSRSDAARQAYDALMANRERGVPGSFTNKLRVAARPKKAA